MNPFIQSRKRLPHAQGQTVDGASLSCRRRCLSSFFFATAGGVSPSSSFSSLFPKRPMSLVVLYVSRFYASGWLSAFRLSVMTTVCSLAPLRCVW